MRIRYEILTEKSEISNKRAGELNELLKCLTEGRKGPIPLSKWRKIAAAPQQRFVVAIDTNGTVVGMAHAVFGFFPPGDAGFVESVAVLKSHEGRGIGKKLNMILIEEARSFEEVERLDLSSQPKRERANRMYQSLGYERRNEVSNYYRLRIR